MKLDLRLLPLAVATWVGTICGYLLVGQWLAIWGGWGQAILIGGIGAVAVIGLAYTWRAIRRRSQRTLGEVRQGISEGSELRKMPAIAFRVVKGWDRAVALTVLATVLALLLGVLGGSNLRREHALDPLNAALADDSAVVAVIGEVTSMPTRKKNGWGDQYWSFQVSAETVTYLGKESRINATLIVQQAIPDTEVSATSATSSPTATGALGTDLSNSSLEAELDAVNSTDVSSLGASSPNASPEAPVSWGQRVRAYGTIVELSGSQIQGIVKTITLTPLEGGSKLRQLASHLKEKLAAVAQTTGGSGWALISGMAVGYDEPMAQNDQEAMQVASLTHLTAVSGSHLAITVSLLALVTKPKRGGQALLSIIFLGLILMVVGPEPSVLRCVAIGIIGAWGLAAAQGGQSLAALFAVIIAGILIQPELAFSVGFQMSVAATLAILVPGRALMERYQNLNLAGRLPETLWARWGSKLIDNLVSVVIISGVCALAVAPLMAQINDWQPTYGVFANVLVAPAVPVITICGLLAAATCAWSEPIAAICCQISAPFAEWTLAVAHWVSELPGAKMPWLSGVPGMVAASSTWLVFYLVYRWDTRNLPRWINVWRYGRYKWL